MIISKLERHLCRFLCELPWTHGLRYTDEACAALLETLFWSLAGDKYEYLRLFFPKGQPISGKGRWSLREAQGAVEGAEYSRAARGKPCGHIFKCGDTVYRCKTCSTDDSCVLCAKCFDASDHSGHMVSVNLSPGNRGCCDCGDPEAWRVPVKCAIHTATPEDDGDDRGKGSPGSQIRPELEDSIRITVARVLDYICDVISCSPEQLRLSKTEKSIIFDEATSRLRSKYYDPGDRDDLEPEYAMILWNDEKHTVTEVQQQVNRACKKPTDFGLAKAMEADQRGRSILEFDRSLPSLLEKLKLIEQIKITATIRSSRDTFREQMCGTMIEWLLDIAGGSVGEDNQILRQTICEEMLKTWRTGSEASNAIVGGSGLHDYSVDGGVVRLGIARPVGTTVADHIMGQDEADADTTSDAEGVDEDDDEMELDLAGMVEDADGDLDMGTFEDTADDTEVAEATYAGYPPPPPPPPPPPAPLQQASGGGAADPASGPSGSVATGAPSLAEVYSQVALTIPKTPKNSYAKGPQAKPPVYWLKRPSEAVAHNNPPLEEDLWRRVRLDWLILFDLRLWKKARTDLRDLYITTVVAIPHFKRILGLRFAGLYTTLAQLYLIADREPDHSIINLSVQMLTTPSITEEVVARGNFLTNLLAILYTFLTTRQVGHPEDVNATLTLAFSTGSLTNRRIYNFFLDLRFLFSSDRVQERVRREGQYLAQFLDFVKLHQGICPNVRAVGEHVEYETDAWITASFITRELNRLCRLFGEAFRWERGQDGQFATRAVRAATYVTVRNSLGLERARFSHAEIKEEIKFRTFGDFEFDVDERGHPKVYQVVRFVVEKQPISFHHALHYTLSWLIECVKSMSSAAVRELMLFTGPDIKRLSGSRSHAVEQLSPDDLLLAVFDFPLRVCVWLAQMKAGMWVRNGLSLRHQMSTYRGVNQRDVAYYRDIFLLQTALVVCDPSRVLATMIDRYGMDHWTKGVYDGSSGHDLSQIVDVAEDFIHLMIIILSDRLSLISPEEEPKAHELAIRREIAHVLCFKPLSFSDLTSRVSDRYADMEEFQGILDEMTVFRPPEGLSDTGTFVLKPQYLEEIDPYVAQYNKNQREESENIVRAHLKKKVNGIGGEIVIEPKLRPIRSGVFANLLAFTRTAIFVQVIYYSLKFPLRALEYSAAPPVIRLETFLQVVLHLCLIATAEDKQAEGIAAQGGTPSFVDLALSKRASSIYHDEADILGVLHKLLALDEYRACRPKIKLVLRRMREKRPNAYASAISSLGGAVLELDTSLSASAEKQDAQQKKQLALDRQARVMAQFQQQQQNFLERQGNIDWGDDDYTDPEEQVDTPTEGLKKLWKYPSGTCILCQEETNDSRLYGTFALVGESNILRQTDLDDPDFVAEAAHVPSSLDRSADAIRPFGVASRNRELIRRLDGDGHEVAIERRGLGKGFPASQVRHGPVTTGCAHIMHYACFDLYYQATQRRQNNHIARAHPERLDKKEFVCPLCKALGNLFLPIIWKGKEEVFPGVVQTDPDFDTWLISRAGPLISRLEKSAEKGSEPQAAAKYHQRFKSVASESWILSAVDRAVDRVAENAPRQRYSLASIANAGGWGSAAGSSLAQTSTTSPTNTGSSEPLATVELSAAYRRIRDTLRGNDLPTQYLNLPAMADYADESGLTDLAFTDTLARTLGFSISAVEIAQRGVPSAPGAVLLDKVPQQALTTLRVLSETISSYIALGVSQSGRASKVLLELRDTQKRQLHQLFVGHPQIFDSRSIPAELSKLEPLLALDTFVFLAECSICLVPALQLDIHHVLRLCYTAEVARVILAYLQRADYLTRYQDQHGHLLEGQPLPYTPEQMTLFVSFVDRVLEIRDDAEQMFRLGPAASSPTRGDGRALPLLRHLVSNYALPFLRKSVILLHVRYGVDFPDAGFAEMDEPELSRLSRLLRLPSLDELFSSFLSRDYTAATVQYMLAGWVRHWALSRENRLIFETSPALSLSHPGIFELVALPHSFDVLLEEAMKRPCPTTGGDLTEPCMCLFCGDIFCGQALCCTVKRGNKTIGGCNQHLEKCGPHVGLFIILRKCVILYVHDGQGGYHSAPYLDKHGEADLGLRRSRQLFLNQRRYDALLRNVWLQHAIPSTISRRLEADINNGGWETI